MRHDALLENNEQKKTQYQVIIDRETVEWQMHIESAPNFFLTKIVYPTMSYWLLTKQII